VLTGTATVAAASTSEATAFTSTTCSGITWGSLPKADGFVAYVPQVTTQAVGDVVPLRGGAKVQVAAELYVSTNTVKTHVAAIYRKLEAQNRREAIARGRQLHLI
jgi:LuxR family maltose regulon positive regulatory protein